MVAYQHTKNFNLMTPDIRNGGTSSQFKEFKAHNTKKKKKNEKKTDYIFWNIISLNPITKNKKKITYSSHPHTHTHHIPTTLCFLNQKKKIF